MNATTAVGPRSSHRLVSPHNGPALQAVKSEHPDGVMEMIVAAGPKETA
ncbi:hypothetical protein GCM10010517_11400 [Streptosporangium fragile]|uniref:Uncharacterized protein n=1 Tax=Streptosporangium fragile TaxID=46186 RepID=A0ABN3VSU4_9ACTN